jgi:hypothetical protein
MLHQHAAGRISDDPETSPDLRVRTATRRHFFAAQPATVAAATRPAASIRLDGVAGVCVAVTA